MATSYTINDLDSRLKNYLDVNKDQLIMDSIFNSKSSKLFSLQTGVKSETAIVRLDSTVEFANDDCSFSAGGSDTFTNRTLVPNFIKVNKVYCDKDLLNSWKASDVRIAATSNDSIPFEQQILENNANVISAEIEKILWQGDKTNGQGNMAFANGLVKMINDDITNTVIPAANVIAKGSDSVYERVQKLWLALPANIADKCTIVMNITNYKNMIVELADANLFHIFEEYDGEYRMRLPFANIDVIGVEGLEGVDNIYAMPLDEVYYGVDLENDNEDVDFYFDKSDRNFKYVCEFVIAIQYAFPTHIYINK
jgi:hypothetical protein